MRCFPRLVEMSHKFLDLSLSDMRPTGKSDESDSSTFSSSFSYDEELSTSQCILSDELEYR